VATFSRTIAGRTLVRCCTWYVRVRSTIGWMTVSSMIGCAGSAFHELYNTKDTEDLLTHDNVRGRGRDVRVHGWNVIEH
jgi:hypothetical protein